MYQNRGFVAAFYALDIIDLDQNENENGISLKSIVIVQYLSQIKRP